MPRGKRKRVATNIYRDQHGYAAVVRLPGITKEIRFPPTSSIAEIRRAMEVTRSSLDAGHASHPARGSLAAVVKTYLDQQPPTRQKDRSQLLTPWVVALGHKPFTALSRAELTAITQGWRNAGISASRVNKRISALRVAWDTVAPDYGLPHAIGRVQRFTEPPAVTRGLPLDLVARVLENVADFKTGKGTPQAELSRAKARLAVLAWTGQPPARVRAIRAEHVRWDRTPPELYVQPRRKGTGSADAWLPLAPLAVAALRAFFRAGAEGDFPLPSLSRALARAVKRTQAALRDEGRNDDARRLDGFRLYDLRHSWLSAMGSTAPDIYAVAEYAGHASLQTTRRYMRAASSTRMRQSVDAMTATLPPVPRPSATPEGRKVQRKRTKVTKNADN